MPDKDASGRITEREGEALSIRGFQNDMRLKLWGIFPANGDHPPEFCSDPCGIEGHRRGRPGMTGSTEEERKQAQGNSLHRVSVSHQQRTRTKGAKNSLPLETRVRAVVVETREDFTRWLLYFPESTRPLRASLSKDKKKGGTKRVPQGLWEVWKL